MDKPASPEKPIRRAVRLDQHDSVRSHVRERISSEVEHLERRIASLRLSRAPHADILISTYERLLDRKKGFLKSWNLKDGGPR